MVEHHSRAAHPFNPVKNAFQKIPPSDHGTD